jgi:hypothetical protein
MITPYKRVSSNMVLFSKELSNLKNSKIVH